MLCKSMNWFLYDRDLRHGRDKCCLTGKQERNIKPLRTNVPLRQKIDLQTNQLTDFYMRGTLVVKRSFIVYFQVVGLLRAASKSELNRACLPRTSLNNYSSKHLGTASSQRFYTKLSLWMQRKPYVFRSYPQLFY